MALQTEIWISSVVGALFADNSFLSKSVDHSQFVDNKRVHVPNAGSASGVEKNRQTYPAAVHQRTDVDLDYEIDTYTTNPIYLRNAETIELSYDKRESVLSQDRAELHEAIASGILKRWAPSGDVKRIFNTSGKAAVAYVPAATGNRKKLTKADVMAVMTQFNKDNVPSEDRYLLLDAIMYTQLLEDLTTQESQAFFACADPANGVLGKLLSFNVMQRSEVLVFEGTTAKEVGETPKAADNAAALAWHKNSLSRALGEVNMYGNEGDPTYYGDIYSFEARAGGSPIRHDKKGVAVIVQSASA